MDLLTIAFVAWLITKAIASDAPWALRGKMPPAHLERMERLRRGETLPPRYGLGGYLRDLFDDALRADVERRRRRREQQAEGDAPSPDGPPPASGSGDGDGQPEPAAVPDPEAGPAPPQQTPSPSDQQPEPADTAEPVDEPSPDTDTASEPAPAGQRGGSRCVYPMPERPHGMCGEPVEDQTNHGGQPGNHHCRFHTAATQHPEGLHRQTEPTGKPATVIPFPVQPKPDQQGDPMSTDTTTPSGVTEITGLASAVQYTQGVAAAHESHGAGESFVASLRTFKVGEADVALVEAAQEASRNAAAKWQTAADALINHNSGVREAYQASPEAGDRQFVTSE